MSPRSRRHIRWTLTSLTATCALVAGFASHAAPRRTNDFPMSIPTVPLPSPHAPPIPTRTIELECFIDPETRKEICIEQILVQGVGGTTVQLGSAPWQAQIYSVTHSYSEAAYKLIPKWEREHRCGGSLIAPLWVLTAAHCIVQQNIRDGYRVRLGTQDLSSEDGTSFLVQRMIRHADYDDKTKLNDIALLRLVADGKTRPLPADKVRPVALHRPLGGDRPLTPGQELFATGWGKTSPGPDGRHSAVLIEVSVDVVPPAQCAKGQGYAKRIAPTVVCAAAFGIDTCTGDSGGPLVAYKERIVDHGSFTTAERGEPMLAGIVSWGKGCAESGNPGVYTRVSDYLDWIRRAMAAPPEVNSLR